MARSGANEGLFNSERRVPGWAAAPMLQCPVSEDRWIADRADWDAWRCELRGAVVKRPMPAMRLMEAAHLEVHHRRHRYLTRDRVMNRSNLKGLLLLCALLLAVVTAGARARLPRRIPQLAGRGRLLRCQLRGFSSLRSEGFIEGKNLQLLRRSASNNAADRFKPLANDLAGYRSTCTSRPPRRWPPRPGMPTKRRSWSPPSWIRWS